MEFQLLMNPIACDILNLLANYLLFFSFILIALDWINILFEIRSNSCLRFLKYVLRVMIIISAMLYFLSLILEYLPNHPFYYRFM